MAHQTAPGKHETITLQPEAKDIRVDSFQPTPEPELADIAPVPSQIKSKIDIEAFKASLGFDPAEIKKRYLAERDKRLRPDGNNQYREVKYDFAHYLEDPYMPRVPRDPIGCSIDFLVLGGGYGGLLLGARLVQASVTNFRIIDKAGDFGGTWYWNRYPGAACDVESYVYMPLLEETGYIPTEKYAKAPELQEHSRRIGRHFGLYDRAIFHTEAKELTWDDESSRWIVKTDRGDTIRTRFIATASGPLNMPKLPGVEGIEMYKGHSFHTSRWDYEYTGGDIQGHLDKIKDRRIGIIGTGATAIQAVPHLGAGVDGGSGHLYVFQRTPSSVDVRANRPTEPAWAASLKPGWQENRMVNFIKAMNGKVSDEEDLVNDGWTKGPKNLKKMGIDRRDKASLLENAALYEMADMQVMQGIRARCDEVVTNKKTAEELKAWYRRFCKRPCFHDEYLQTFNIPNVTLIDTDGQGIDRITEKGIVANGQEYELDCIIYSTGFEVGTDYSRRSNFKVTGKNGIELSDHWKDGWHTFHGFHTRGFPNLFVISTTQSGFTANFVHMLNEQSKHLAYIVAECKERGIKSVEATQEAEDAWVEEIVNGSWLSAGFQKECTPGYYNLEGQITESPKAKRQGNYPAGPLGFVKCLREWREKDDLKGLETVGDENWRKSKDSRLSKEERLRREVDVNLFLQALARVE